MCPGLPVLERVLRGFSMDSARVMCARDGRTGLSDPGSFDPSVVRGLATYCWEHATDRGNP